MTLKLIGSLLIIIACSGYGFFKAFSLKKRCDNLIEIKNTVNALKSQICFFKTELTTALLNVSGNSSVSALFTDFADNIKRLGVDEAWLYSLDKNRSKLFISAPDCELLKYFSKNLGKTDSENQLNSLNFFINLLDELYSNANAQYKLKSSIYKSAGASIGFLAVLILL